MDVISKKKLYEKINCSYITEWIDIVDSEKYPVSNEIKQLNELLKLKFEKQDIYVDIEKVEGVIELIERYRPYELTPVQKFLHSIPYIFFRDGRKAQHPILTKIQLVNTTGITRWLARKADAEGAVWGKLGSEITKKLDNSFEVIDTQINKLSAFVPLSKDMLALGPIWLDKFVRAILQESIAIGLEKAIITRTGVDQPIGMLKDIMKSVNPTTGYPDRTAVALPDLKPATLGKLVMKPLVDGKVKTVQGIILVCNPGDYWEKIFPQTTVQDLNGNYVFNKLPIAADIVQSVYVPEGKMIACVPEDYFMGIGFNSMIQFSDEYHFLEDERIYITKMAGHGKPIEAKSNIFNQVIR